MFRWEILPQQVMQSIYSQWLQELILVFFLCLIFLLLLFFQRGKMRLTKTNWIFLIIFVLVLIAQVYYATTTACPASAISKSDCWGPKGINFLGFNVNIDYVLMSSSWLLWGLGLSLLIALIVRMIKPEKTRESLMNLVILISLIIYLIGALWTTFITL